MASVLGGFASPRTNCRGLLAGKQRGSGTGEYFTEHVKDGKYKGSLRPNVRPEKISPVNFPDLIIDLEQVFSDEVG